jgi:hypothetical protein
LKRDSQIGGMEGPDRAGNEAQDHGNQPWWAEELNMGHPSRVCNLNNGIQIVGLTPFPV